MQQYVEGFRDTRRRHDISFYHRLVCFCTANDVIGFHRQDFLENVGGTKCFQCPNFHFSETLTSELRLTTQRLLSDQRVRTDRTRMHLVVDHVTELQHVDNSNCCGLVEFFTSTTVVEICASELRQAGLGYPLVDLLISSTVENWRCEFHTELQSCPSENGFIDLAQVHTRRHTERIEHDVNRCSVLQVRHVFVADNLRNDTLVTVTTGHL